MITFCLLFDYAYSYYFEDYFLQARDRNEGEVKKKSLSLSERAGAAHLEDSPLDTFSPGQDI